MNLKCDFILMFVSARGPKARQSCSSVTSSCFAVFLCLGLAHGAPGANGLAVLNPDGFAHHVAKFNSMEDENVTNYISNAPSWSWLEKIPFFHAPIGRWRRCTISGGGRSGNIWKKPGRFCVQ